MTTQLRIHTATSPTFEFRHHETFTVLEMSCVSEGGVTTEVIIFLPQGMTKGDFVKAAVDSTERKAGPSRKATE